MASGYIHLAITKNYLKKYSYLSKEDVLRGTIYPDTVKDKNISHYGDMSKRGKDIISHLQGKVNLYSFLIEHTNLTDFEFGWFLHLMQDFLFFDECFSKDYLLTHSYEDFRSDLYFGYECSNDYLAHKYAISREDFTIYPDEMYPGIPYQDNILSKELIDSFIDRASSIDICQYIEQIKIAKRNIKPY